MEENEAMIKDSKGKCESQSHKLLKEKAKSLVGDLQTVFTNLQTARKESRADDIASLEELVLKTLGKFNDEINAPSPESSQDLVNKSLQELYAELSGGNLESFSELKRLLRTDEEDDATSPFKELPPQPKPVADLETLHFSNMQFTEDFFVSPEPQESFQGFYQWQDNALGFPNLMLDSSDLYHPSTFPQDVSEGVCIGTNVMKQHNEDAMPNVLLDNCPAEPSFWGSTCALWDCSRLAEKCTDYCCSYHANLALEDGQLGKAPVSRPRGISLKDGALFEALISWNQGKAVGIPNCEGAATVKSPWNATDRFDLSFFEGETVREWLFFDKPRKAFGSGNRKQRSLSDYEGRGWHESRKQIVKEFSGQKKSYYMDPQPSKDCEWHLFEYEINNSDACALYRLEWKMKIGKSPKAKVSKEVSDLQKKMGRLTAEVVIHDTNSSKGKSKIKADAGNICSAQN